MDVKVPTYKDKSDEWWTTVEQHFPEWIEAKYGYCLHECLSVIKKQAGEDSEKLIYPMILKVLMDKNSYSEQTQYRQLDDCSLHRAFKLYCDLVAKINEYTLFLPSKQTFCEFINIPVQMFNEWGRSGSGTAAVIEMINDYFTANIAYAGQSGLAKSSIVSLMLKAEDAGQGIMTAKESKSTNFSKARFSMEEIQKRLESLN